MAQRLLKELREVLACVHDGRDVSVDGVDVLLADIRRSVKELTEDEIIQLNGIIREIEHVARDRFEEIGEEIRRLNHGRQALRGYNHIRGLDRGQRLYRRA